ncbi:hypothetical protein [Methanobrevibacter sp.]|uniref:hypothetical protein n=1 Tax=Methanobrevibacter sp. TaxID=66852 RepID=UPI0025ED002C|nr:hypothetical protein [Methanobrevibacter sp.]MBQ2832746.1 hypothetical protein [Methanobrevibacter sp.]MBQ2832961.1 hypothetical protein [Methanobrevibacter sp.]
MNVKRIFLIALIALVVFASVSAVSAGWFDFLGGGDSDTVDNVTVDIISSSVKYSCAATGNDLSIQSNGNNFSVNSDSSEVDKEITYRGTAKINVSTMNHEQLKDNLSSNNWTISVEFGNIAGSLSFYVYEYTIEDGVMTLFFNGTDHINSYDPVKPGDSGVTNVTGGDVRIYKEGSGNESAFIIYF